MILYAREMLSVVILYVLLRGYAQIMSKASYLKRHRLEAALTAYKAKVSTRTLLVQAQRELSRMRNEERASEGNAQNGERSAQVKHTDMHIAFFLTLAILSRRSLRWRREFRSYRHSTKNCTKHIKPSMAR